ncbi:hypothetical protein FPQ18DRAFT_310058 [Pyronema domesticum]|nr:hypothetical protein FPQ18DRAFT_310058 [Pyronema domesticum]
MFYIGGVPRWCRSDKGNLEDFRFLNSLESSPPASLPDLKKLSKFAKPSRTIGENISYRITPRDTIFPIPRNRLGNPGHDDCVGNQAIWNLSASLGSRGARGALFVTSIPILSRLRSLYLGTRETSEVMVMLLLCANCMGYARLNAPYEYTQYPNPSSKLWESGQNLSLEKQVFAIISFMIRSPIPVRPFVDLAHSSLDDSR